VTPRIGSFWLLIGCVAVSAATASGEPRAEKPCREHPKLAGACFTLRGRMRLANGTPTVRIWPVGTRRLLLVSEGRFVVDGYSNLPEEISRRLSWDSDLFADFEVCPFTRPEPGVARLVCVESAKNVSMRKRD
jgi:hypothetical protein